MTKIDIFRNAREIVAFEPGQIVFSEGDPGDRMYAVVEGIVELSRNGTVIETVGEGNIFGELALVDDHSRGATAPQRPWPASHPSTRRTSRSSCRSTRHLRCKSWR